MATPVDSRYIPLTQSPYLCVPTCLQMVMYKNGIPLIPAEEIGYSLGLTVPEEDGHLFFAVRTSPTPSASSGYGTQIQHPEYEPNAAMEHLSIPLHFSQKLSSEILSVDTLVSELRSVEHLNQDALLCFNPGVFYKNTYEPDTGHVVVFDRIIDGKVRIVDPAPKQPKWCVVDPLVLYEAIRAHGDANSGGIWYLAPLLDNPN